MLFVSAGLAGYPCTVFVLTDSENTLFFNNEDFSNPNTRVWFVPGGSNYFGAVYVGFDDGWAQGGMNSEGLAFDWVAGSMRDYKPTNSMLQVRGNPSARMLEACRTVPEAIAFYKQHAEPSFDQARILVADRTGASVIIGARDGQLEFVQSQECRGFGYGHDAVDKALKQLPKATIQNGLSILQAVRQEGIFATKYSNVFDLRNRTLTLFPDGTKKESFLFSIKEELSKGGHYYDIPDLAAQRKQALKSLLPEMKRFYLDEFQPVTVTDRKLTARVERMIRDAIAGKPQQTDYAPDLWKQLPPPTELQKQLMKLGNCLLITEVEQKGTKQTIPGQIRFIFEYEKAKVLQVFKVNLNGEVAVIETESVEPKPGARL